eukprot:ctg_1921.g397
MPSPPPAFAAGTFGAGIAQRHHTNALLSSFNVGRTRSPVAARTRRRLGGRPPPPPPHHRRARHPPAFLSRALAADSDDSDADATPDSSGASASDLGTPRLPPTEEARRRELADDRVTEMRVRFPRQVRRSAGRLTTTVWCSSPVQGAARVTSSRTTSLVRRSATNDGQGVRAPHRGLAGGDARGQRRVRAGAGVACGAARTASRAQRRQRCTFRDGPPRRLLLTRPVRWRAFSLSLGHDHIPDRDDRCGITHEPSRRTALTMAARSMASGAGAPIRFVVIARLRVCTGAGSGVAGAPHRPPAVHILGGGRRQLALGRRAGSESHLRQVVWHVAGAGAAGRAPVGHGPRGARGYSGRTQRVPVADARAGAGAAGRFRDAAGAARARGGGRAGGGAVARPAGLRGARHHPHRPARSTTAGTGDRGESALFEQAAGGVSDALVDGHRLRPLGARAATLRGHVPLAAAHQPVLRRGPLSPECDGRSGAPPTHAGTRAQLGGHWRAAVQVAGVYVCTAAARLGGLFRQAPLPVGRFRAARRIAARMSGRRVESVGVPQGKR